MDISLVRNKSQMIIKVLATYGDHNIVKVTNEEYRPFKFLVYHRANNNGYTYYDTLEELLSTLEYGEDVWIGVKFGQFQSRIGEFKTMVSKAKFNNEEVFCYEMSEDATIGMANKVSSDSLDEFTQYYNNEFKKYKLSKFIVD